MSGAKQTFIFLLGVMVWLLVTSDTFIAGMVQWIRAHSVHLVVSGTLVVVGSAYVSSYLSRRDEEELDLLGTVRLNQVNELIDQRAEMMHLIDDLADLDEWEVQRLKEYLVERRNKLEGLNERQTEVIIKKWIGQIYNEPEKANNYEVSPLSAQKAQRIIIDRGTRCQYPGCREDISLEVHHIRPRNKGGTNDEKNLAVLCPTHHSQADRGVIPQARLKEIIR